MKSSVELDAARNRYLTGHEAFLNGRSEAVWLRDLRLRAIQRFAELGFPTTRHEEWKYTDTRPIAAFETGDTPSPNGHSSVEKWQLEGALRLAFVAGKFAPELSQLGQLPDGVTVCSLAEALSRDSEIVQQNLTRYAEFDDAAFAALNTAFFEDGAFIHVPQNVQVQTPIHLLFLTPDGALSQPRNLFLIGDNSQITIVEEYAAKSVQGRGFTNSVTEISAGKNAQIDHYKVTTEGEAAFHVGTMQVQQDRDCSFSSHSITFGGQIVRHQANAIMGESGIETTLNGLYVGGADQVIDNHTVMDHAQPHCNSHEIYAGVLAGRARGINQHDAQDILTYAFAGEILERVQFVPLRERLEKALFAKLQSVR